jgi:hypothetical protein
MMVHHVDYVCGHAVTLMHKRGRGSGMLREDMWHSAREDTVWDIKTKIDSPAPLMPLMMQRKVVGPSMMVVIDTCDVM